MRQVNALLINDVHIGAVRSAGTTIKTRAEIQEYLQVAFRDIVMEAGDLELDIIVNGDLFDSYEVDTGQVLETYMTLHNWLFRYPGRVVDLVLGNHDIAKNSQRTSSFALLCSILKASYPDQVNVYNQGLAQIGDKVWVIPHCLNQASFDVEIGRAVEVTEPGFLLLHANFDNNFAIEADHSLNVSDEQARALVKHGWTLVFAHEHQRRKMLAGQVIITGNQWPTSVADCLSHGEAQKDGKKFAHIIETHSDFMSDTAIVTIVETATPTWQAEGDYIEMDWRDLQPSECRFIRVTGTAEAGESADMVGAIARYRQKSDALVITNAVKVAGIAGVSEMATLSVEKLQGIDVLTALCEKLTPDEGKRVRALLEPEEQPATETSEAA